jgi:hypothetical protein
LVIYSFGYKQRSLLVTVCLCKNVAVEKETIFSKVKFKLFHFGIAVCLKLSRAFSGPQNTTKLIPNDTGTSLLARMARRVIATANVTNRNAA